MKRILAIVGLVFLSALAGWYLSSKQQSDSPPDRWSASVLLEAVRNVDKIVLVEGDLNELFTYRNFSYWNNWPFRKKTLLKLTGTASVGYDLAEADLYCDPEGHTLILSMDTMPELISLSHEVTVVDIEEDWMNAFAEEDWTRVHRAARAYLERAVRHHRLYERARLRLDQKLQGIKSLCHRAGWTFELRTSNAHMATAPRPIR